MNITFIHGGKKVGDKSRGVKSLKSQVIIIMVVIMLPIILQVSVGHMEYHMKSYKHFPEQWTTCSGFVEIWEALEERLVPIHRHKMLNYKKSSFIVDLRDVNHSVINSLNSRAMHSVDACVLLDWKFN